MARDRHFWIMALLYTLTFGSFVGFAASLPILTASLFGRADYGWLAFAGAFLAALMRPVGHVIAGRFGSVRLTVCVFALLACGFGALPLFAPVDGTGGHYAAFIATATLIFAATGLGNGSTISMLPDIYLVPMLRRGGIDAAERKALRARAARSTAIALGLVSAVATFGAFLMPKIFDWSLAWLADASYAMYCFAFLNLLCLAVTWRVYGRKAAGNPLCIGNAGHRGFVIVDRADRYGELT